MGKKTGKKSSRKKVKDAKKVKTTEVIKGEICLDCGKKISKEKFAEQEGFCDKCYGPFVDDVSQEEYPEQMWGD